MTKPGFLHTTQEAIDEAGAIARAFEQEHGRKPRILHVGNIANNGYNNAKVLVQSGFECDVLAYDYYHIMGCPEWEDADFHGDVGSHGAPAWGKVQRGGYRRPAWFAQGPVKLAVGYLIARRAGRPFRASVLWRLMAAYRWLNARGVSRRRISQTAFYQRVRSIIRPGHDVQAPDGQVNAPPVAEEPLGRFAWVKVPMYRIVRRIARALRFRLKRIWNFVFCGEDFEASEADRASFAERNAMLCRVFAQLFPDRDDQMSIADAQSYSRMICVWQKLFSRYDIVEAYATDPILCMLSGVRRYVCYEHGTLRGLPFNDAPVSRLTALAYALADEVVITNPDCNADAERLKVARSRFVPHLIDAKYSDRAIIKSGGPDQIPDGRYVFCPARHSWADKGSDLMIRAFAQAAEADPDLMLVTPSWGGDVEKSKALIRELGIEDRVRSTPCIPIQLFIRVAGRASCLIDQFRFGVFGGIGPTALALGTPLVTHLEHRHSSWCMEEPPYFEAYDAGSCVKAVAQALASATGADAEDRREERRAWMRRNYWHGDVAVRHAQIYRDVWHRAAEGTPSRLEEILSAMDATGAVRHDTLEPAANA